MPLKHYRNYQALKQIIHDCGLQGRGSYDRKRGLCTFRADTGEIVNFWVKTKSVNVQGAANASFRKKLTSALQPPTRTS